MATNLTTDNLKKSSSLNSTEYNSTLNVITADGDTLKRLPISEVVKNRIEKLSYPEKPIIVESGDTWLEEKEIGKGIARQKALQNNAQINFDKDIYFFNNKVFCLTSTGYAIIDVSTDSTSGDIYVTGNYKHIVSDNIFIWFIANTVEESKCFRIETMEELTTELDTSVSSIFALDDLGSVKQSGAADCNFIDCALLVFLDRENNFCAGVEFSVKDSTDKWTIERYLYNTTGILRSDSVKVTSFTDIGITLGETKCSFYLDSYKDSASLKTYKAICVNKLDDLTEYMREQFVPLVPDLEFENATNIIYVNRYMIEKTPFRYYIAPLVVCDTFIAGSSIITNTEEMLVAGQNFIYSQKQNRIVFVDMSTGTPVIEKDVTLSKTYGKVIDVIILSNGNIKILTEGEQFGKTIDLILNYTEKTFDIQETEAISEEVKNIQKMFASDIGEVYIEQADTDKIYLVGKSYDTSIKVQTVNGEKTIPTLDGMDELETRVQNIEKKVSSSENEMSLIETEINKVNKNIADVNANVESVGEQVAQWVLIGEVKQYFGATVPDKYLLCNGQEIAQADYPELYAVIGSLPVCQSDTDGMFKVPDLRGEFLRGAGVNSHAGQGNGGELGEHQDATRHITMSQWTDPNQASGNIGFYGYGGTNSVIKNRDSNLGLVDKAYKLHTIMSNLSTGESDVPYYTSRPTNTSINFIIRAKT